MPRAQWKGFLRLSLVTIAVELYNAVEAGADIGFNMIHKPTGKRVNYTKTVSGEPVENADIVKGYPIERDTYVTFTPEELDAVKLETKKTLDLSEFVDASQIDPRYFERPYYIALADEFAGEGWASPRFDIPASSRFLELLAKAGGSFVGGRATPVIL